MGTQKNPAGFDPAGLSGIGGVSAEKSGDLGLGFLVHADVEHLDKDREGHGEIHITFLEVNVKAFSYQGGADQQEEGKRQHFHGRVVADKVTDCAREDHHEADGDHHR